MFCLAGATTGLASPFPAQAAVPDENTIPTLRVSFGEAVAGVGQEVALPIRMRANTTLRVPFTLVLRYPPSQLDYRKLGIGPLPQKAGWKLTANLRKTPPAFDMFFLEIEIEPSGEDFFPEGGLFAEAYFTVLGTGEEHSIELSTSIASLDQIELHFEAEAALIRARPTPMYACFFYMH